MASSRRLVVTGLQGQVARCLVERGGADPLWQVVPIGRPALDLADIDRIEAALTGACPNVIVSAAAYTAVDQAEHEEMLATTINGRAAGEIARVAEHLGVPLIHLSTDYVFDGTKAAPYVETDPVAPLGAYGRSKLAGEQAVRAACANSVVLRTAWVYSPFGRNFVRTMLRLAENHERVSVVDDQIGNPTSAHDIADGVLAVAQNLLSSADSDLRGVFHMTGGGETSWAGFASEIFAAAAGRGAPAATVDPIPSGQYPTPAKRPANSRLGGGELLARHGVALPDWCVSLHAVVGRLLDTNTKEGVSL